MVLENMAIINLDEGEPEDDIRLAHQEALRRLDDSLSDVGRESIEHFYQGSAQIPQDAYNWQLLVKHLRNSLLGEGMVTRDDALQDLGLDEPGNKTAEAVIEDVGSYLSVLTQILET